MVILKKNRRGKRTTIDFYYSNCFVHLNGKWTSTNGQWTRHFQLFWKYWTCSVWCERVDVGRMTNGMNKNRSSDDDIEWTHKLAPNIYLHWGDHRHNIIDYCEPSQLKRHLWMDNKSVFGLHGLKFNSKSNLNSNYRLSYGYRASFNNQTLNR